MKVELAGSGGSAPTDEARSSSQSQGTTERIVARLVDHKTYEKLVTEKTDLVGHVAYALYKRDKLEFCRSEELRKVPVTADGIDHFIRSSNLPARIDQYRAEASVLLRSFSDIMLEEAIEENRREYEERLTAELKGLVDRVAEQKKWSQVAIEAVVGNVAVALVWAILVVVLFTTSLGFSQTVLRLFNIDLTKASIPASQSR